MHLHADPCGDGLPQRSNGTANIAAQRLVVLPGVEPGTNRLGVWRIEKWEKIASTRSRANNDLPPLARFGFLEDLCPVVCQQCTTDLANAARPERATSSFHRNA
jgi:hypothetical protein